MTIKKATILGAGIMGSQIAALLVNAGLQVKILDIVIDETDPNKLSKAAYDRITNPKKSQLYMNELAANLSYGNFQDDLSESSDSDIFIEAVSEKLEIKHNLWEKVAKVAKAGAILTTNTSGIPIGEIAEVLEGENKSHFLGFHFFNPPRHMKLVEIIPHENTDPKVVELLTDFTIQTLGKGVVVANDVSGFVGNRIGVYTMVDAMNRAEEQGLSINEVDAITGQIIGRPKTATYRLGDFVGIDIAFHVAQGMKQNIEEEKYFHTPKMLQQLMDKGNLGNKSKQGFYKKDGKTIYMYDVVTEDYIEQKPVDFAIMEKLGRNLTKNLQVIFDAEDEIGKFIWDTLANVMYYSAINVPKATQDHKNIDRAMVWGYNWKLGPFQLWDAIGFEKVKERLRETHGELPEWIENRDTNFYGENDSISQVKGLEAYVSKPVWDHKGVSDLYEAENDLLVYVLRTPNNSITGELSKDILQAVKVLEEGPYRGMIVYAEGSNFSVGANLVQISQTIKDKTAEEFLPEMIGDLHNSVLALKHSTKPIVTAARGRALGGGAELLLYSPFVVAAAESYIGLVEMGVGVLPSGGGLAELAERVYLKGQERGEEIKQLGKVFRNVAFAKVSGHAYEAREMGLLKETDVIIQNEELILEAALKKADLEASYNYLPAAPKQFAVEGTNYRAIAQAELDTLVSGNFASDYDRVIGTEIATVLSGGKVPLGTLADQRYLMNLEKESFIKLCRNEKTLDRMVHMLDKKKPLRN